MVYAFRRRDALTGKWYRARWKATADEIAKLGGVIDGPPEIREPIKGYFAPFGPLVSHAELMRLEERQPDMHPRVTDDERWLARLCLRRYVTWCARSGRRERIEATGRLYRCLAAPPSQYKKGKEKRYRPRRTVDRII